MGMPRRRRKRYVLRVVDIRVETRYFADGLWTAPELMGWSTSVDGSDCRVTLLLPVPTDDWAVKHTGFSQVPAISQAGAFIDSDFGEQAVAVNLLKLLVEFSVTGPAPSEELGAEEHAWAESLAVRADREASGVVAAFLTHARAKTHQPWMPPVLTARPYSPSNVFIAPDRFVLGVGPSQSVTWSSPRLRLEAAGARAIESALQGGSRASVARILLADAWHFDRGAGPASDSQRAVLSAAMSVEIQAEQHVTRLDEHALLRLLLKKTSNPLYVLQDVVDALGGRGLRDSDKSLYGEVQWLMGVRNKVAHEGHTPTEDDSSRAVRAATSALDWMDSQAPAP